MPSEISRVKKTTMIGFYYQIRQKVIDKDNDMVNSSGKGIWGEGGKGKEGQIYSDGRRLHLGLTFSYMTRMWPSKSRNEHLCIIFVFHRSHYFSKKKFPVLSFIAKRLQNAFCLFKSPLIWNIISVFPCFLYLQKIAGRYFNRISLYLDFFLFFFGFLMIKFRLYVFGRNIMEVMLSSSQYILAGGTWFFHYWWCYLDHLVKVMPVRFFHWKVNLFPLYNQ